MILVVKNQDYDIIVNHAQQIFAKQAQKKLEMLHFRLNTTVNSYQVWFSIIITIIDYAPQKTTAGTNFSLLSIP